MNKRMIVLIALVATVFVVPASAETVEIYYGTDDYGEKIFESCLKINEGIEIEYSINIEVVETSTDAFNSAKFRISSYLKPVREMTIFQGDCPTEYETRSGASIYIEVLSVYGNSVLFRVTGPENWRVTDYYTVESEDDNRIVEIRGEVVELAGTQTEVIMWDAHNFAAFWYDLENDLMTETLMIAPDTLSGYDRTIDEGDLVYNTTATDLRFDLSRWGKYKVIGFMAEKYFAGYSDDTDDEITDEAISLVSKNMLSKVLIDAEDERTISTGASLQLEDGYELKIIQLDVQGNKAQLELLRNGERADNETVNAPDTFVYRKDLGELDDVPVIAVYISSVFAGTVTDMIETDGVFQISENYISVKPGDVYGEMEIASVSGDEIILVNYDDILLDGGEIIDIMDDISFRVSEDEKRFHPFVEHVTCGENAIPATDTDGDGVPDVWDVDNSTPSGYWVNPQGIGRRWGDMNGDGRLTSVDALMILQAAVGKIDL